MKVSLTLAQVGVDCLASCPGPFNSGERAPDIHCIGDFVDPRAGVDDMEKRKFLTIPALEF
jgi:hypothetical protein